MRQFNINSAIKKRAESQNFLRKKKLKMGVFIIGSQVVRLQSAAQITAVGGIDKNIVASPVIVIVVAIVVVIAGVAVPDIAAAALMAIVVKPVAITVVAITIVAITIVTITMMN